MFNKNNYGFGVSIFNLYMVRTPLFLGKSWADLKRRMVGLIGVIWVIPVDTQATITAL